MITIDWSVFMYGPEYQNIIREICKNNGIDYQLYDNRCAMLSRNGHKQFVWSRRFPHNTASSSRIIDSKSVCALMLSSAGLPVVAHSKLYRSDTEGYITQRETNQKICEDILNTFGGVVIKPNDSYEGKDVYACFSAKEIEYALLKVFRKKEILAASPYIDSNNEYRVFYLQGECLMAYRKIRPYVVGDGSSSLQLLISRSNMQKEDIIKSIDFNYIPAMGEKVEIGWKFNLSCGSSLEMLNDCKLKDTLFSLSQRAADVINAQFVTVDFLENRKTKELSILEINAGVAMDQFILKHPQGRTIAYSVYERAIRSLFQMDN